MGLLNEGTALSWEETKARAETIKQLGVQQFLKVWKAESTRYDKEHKWGDEIEYMLVHIDHENKNATVAACQEEILERLNSALSTLSPGSRLKQPAFVTEFTKFQMETSPGAPYSSTLADLLSVEDNMRQRRNMIRLHLGTNESPVTLSSFPRLGAPGIFTHPLLPVSENEPGESVTVPEKLTSSHSRYGTIKANMIAKKGSQVLAYIPIFVDKFTASPFFDPIHRCLPPSLGSTEERKCQGRIFLDSMIFGAGCCCMQVTQQLESLDQAREIYDALLPLAPLLMALTASSPAWRGYLCDTDCRWNVASSCMDERTQKERQEQQRSRWDVNGMYISIAEENKPQYNDVPILCDEQAYRNLREHAQEEALKLPGVDELLSKHNINSSVWQALRLKPPQGPEMGWRVEFRTAEASITDFESAAFAICIVLLSRAVLHFKLNLYIPISKVIDNMHIAQRRNAVKQDRFSFRKVIKKSHKESHTFSSMLPMEYEDMSIDKIFNGTPSFPGLLSFVKRYVEESNPDQETKSRLFEYIDFIRCKANGTYATTATWMRNFIRTHPKYKFDSVISEEIGYHLMVAIDDMSRKEHYIPLVLDANNGTQ
ncbi:Glutamate-cysteine ligase domain containing protein [Amanita muscaria]